MIIHENWHWNSLHCVLNIWCFLLAKVMKIKSRTICYDIKWATKRNQWMGHAEFEIGKPQPPHKSMSRFSQRRVMLSEWCKHTWWKFSRICFSFRCYCQTYKPQLVSFVLPHSVWAQSFRLTHDCHINNVLHECNK